MVNTVLIVAAMLVKVGSHVDTQNSLLQKKPPKKAVGWRSGEVQRGQGDEGSRGKGTAN